MSTIRQLSEERRNRKQSIPELPPGQAGEEWGKCIGVHEVSRTRRVARILLASGFVVTAYLTAGAPAPAVDSDVLVSAAVPCPDQPASGGSTCFFTTAVD